MTSFIKRLFEINIFFSNVIVPLIALALFCYSFAYFSSVLFLEGVNYYFVRKSGQYLLLVIVGVLMIFGIMLRSKKGGKLVFGYSGEKFYTGDFLLLFLPLTPVAQYVINNREILSPTEILFLMVLFTVFSGIYTFALPVFLRSFLSTQTLMLLGLVFVFFIVNMALMSDYFAWFEKGSLKTQWMVFSCVFLAVWLSYTLNRKILYLFVIFNFMVNGSFQLLSQSGKVSASSHLFEENKLLSVTEGKKNVLAPNIYLLVYDAYVPNETMLAYGIDNSAQEEYLTEQGFEIYPHTYSVGPTTLETMSRVLNASTEHYGNPRVGVSGAGITQEILHDLDYKTYGLFYSDYMFRGYGESYDFSIPKYITAPYIQLSKAIFMGEFRFDIENIGFNEQTRNEFLETKRSVFENGPSNQAFIYMHSNLPGHSQNSGACLPDEVDQYEGRLVRANFEMQQDVDLIVDNDPGAIVIVAGDHGPYLTKNCTTTSSVYDVSEISRLDIQDRYATFLAIRWPTEGFMRYDDITVLQDLFPVVFAYIYDDVKILESKIKPIILTDASINSISGAGVDDGVIIGGTNNGESLFLFSE